MNKDEVRELLEKVIEHLPEHMSEDMPTLNRAAMALSLLSLDSLGAPHQDPLLMLMARVGTAALLVGAHNPAWAQAGHWELARKIREAYQKQEGSKEGEAEDIIGLWEVLVMELPGHLPVDQTDVPLDDRI